MAWYDVKFSCGHEERIQLYGPRKGRYRKIEYFERQGLCKACWKEQCRIEEEVAAKRNGLVEVEVGYREYKEKWPNAKQVPGSYDGERKTVHIYLPADSAPKQKEA